MLKPNEWLEKEDGRQADSDLRKYWANPATLVWQLDVRTEGYCGHATYMGRLIFTGSIDSELTASLDL